MTIDISRLVAAPAVIPPMYEHQRKSVEKILAERRVYDASDPGTGKTRVCLEAYDQLRSLPGIKKALVLAPRSILEAAWTEDCRKFTPHLTAVPCFAEKRAESFAKPADIYVTNHDAATWLAKNRDKIAQCNVLIIDEATAYKNKDSQRSRAVATIAPQFEVVVAMCGTPMPNGLEDIWHQIFLVDKGQRLGASFYKFRAATHEPVAVSGFTKWVEKAGASEVVIDLLSDIMIRNRLEDCVDMPERLFTTVNYTLPPKLRDHYSRMAAEARLQLEHGEITAVNAAVLVNKLLQVASGAVYESTGAYHLLDPGRYELVATLAAQRDASLLPFVWTHQKEELLKALAKAGVDRVAVIEGGTHGVGEIVNKFQAGEYQVLLAHPKSASHGLTLTRAATTIWSSPVTELDRFIQFNGRTYRNGQKQKTEVIMVSAPGTADVRGYARLQEKGENQEGFLTLLKEIVS